MLKLFKKMTPDYIDLETYDYSSFAHDMNVYQVGSGALGRFVQFDYIELDGKH